MTIGRRSTSRRVVGYFAIILTLIASVFLTVGVGAQGNIQPLGAVLEVIYGGVELQRAGTGTWIELAPGAVMPTGSGDSIRTDETGRALITLPEANGEILVLPGSTFELTNYHNQTDDSENPLIVFGFTRAGETVHRIPAGAVSYGVIAEHTTAAVAPMEGVHMLVSRRYDASVVVVAEGWVSIPGDDDVFVLRAGDGYLRDDAGEVEFADLPDATSTAGLVGQVRGCPATITTETGNNLNARTGPSTANIQIGQFPDGAEVYVMGVVASGGWYRVQFRAGFGWVQRLALNIEAPESCDIPTLPDDAFDIPRAVLGVTEREFDLLQPFFGTPRQDPNFYRPMPILAD